MTAADHALVKRLRELADGVEVKWPNFGICMNSGEQSLRCAGFVVSATGHAFPFHDNGEGKWLGTRGGERRMFAGFLAAWIESEEV